jgi:chemotaxis protein methyltransferase CheR
MVTITSQEFKQLAKLIEDQYGSHIKQEKSALLTGRLHKVLAELKMETFTEYYKYLLADKSGTALATLIDKVSTNHTYFMREAEHFDYLYHHIFPYLKETVKDRDLRVWCAASATGEEPYTLAMLLLDYFESSFPKWDTQILATDISDGALNHAKLGVYTKEQVAPLPKLWHTKYFDKHGANDYVVKEKVKSQILFRKFNLMEETYPFKKRLHVIFCRNVMIYFDNPTKDKVIEKMYHQLSEGGYFFIGHSESINRATSPFTYIKPAIYRKLSSRR